MKMLLKKFFLGVLLAGAVQAPVNASGIPTFDAANIIQMIEQMNQLIAQYDALREQIDNQNKQIESITGGRNMAGAVGTDDYNNIPTNWEETLNQMNGGDLSSKTNEILETMNGIDTDAFNELDEEYQEVYGKKAGKTASYQAAQGKSYNDAAARFEKIKELIQKIDETDDIKAAIDLNSRISAEMVMLENERHKLESLAAINESQQQLDEIRASQLKAENEKDDWANW